MSYQDRARALRPLIEKAAESLSDNDALEGIELFPSWEPDTTYSADIRLQHEGKLYRVRQGHTSQEQYPPSIDTAALYEEVHRSGQGDTPDNPIPYNNNMELLEGKYYSQYDVVYLCIRSTGIAVYNDLSALVGIYVEVYQQV